MLLSELKIPENLDSIFHNISWNKALRIDKDTVKILISKLIDSNLITVKKTKQSQKYQFLPKITQCPLV